MKKKIRGIRNRVIQTYIKYRFPEWRIEWVSDEWAVAIRSDGKRWLVPDKEPFNWSRFANWFVPASISLCGLIMATGMVLGCMYGNIY